MQLFQIALTFNPSKLNNYRSNTPTLNHDSYLLLLPIKNLLINSIEVQQMFKNEKTFKIQLGFLLHRKARAEKWTIIATVIHQKLWRDTIIKKT